MIGKDGRAALRILRLRHTAFREAGLICTIMTFEEAPNSRYTIGRPKARDRIIEKFQSATGEEECKGDGRDKGQGKGKGGGPPSPPPPLPPPPPLAEAGGGAGGGGFEMDQGALLLATGVLPLTTMGQCMHHTRALDLMAAERHSKRPFDFLLRAPSSPAAAEGMVKEEGGGAGGEPTSPPVQRMEVEHAGEAKGGGGRAAPTQTEVTGRGKEGGRDDRMDHASVDGDDTSEQDQQSQDRPQAQDAHDDSTVASGQAEEGGMTAEEEGGGGEAVAPPREWEGEPAVGGKEGGSVGED